MRKVTQDVYKPTRKVNGKYERREERLTVYFVMMCAADKYIYYPDAVLASTLRAGRQVGTYDVVIIPPLPQFPLQFKIPQPLHRIHNYIVVSITKTVSWQTAMIFLTLALLNALSECALAWEKINDFPVPGECEEAREWCGVTTSLVNVGDQKTHYCCCKYLRA